MTWARLDGNWCTNRKVRAAGPLAAALYASALSWAAAQLSDGFVPDSELGWLANLGRVPDGPTAGVLVEKLIEVRLFDKVLGGVRIHDFLEYNPSARTLKREREANRRRQSFYRDEALKEQIRERDGDRCVYCGVKVVWDGHDERAKATFDRINPQLGYSRRNTVVSCGACNQRKGRKTLAQAGMRLQRVTENVGRRTVSARNVSLRSVPSRPPRTADPGWVETEADWLGNGHR
jgi:5-methylcytosine-specific restriction endonuclease McrA